jgi:hypothetical protein
MLNYIRDEAMAKFIWLRCGIAVVAIAGACTFLPGANGQMPLTPVSGSTISVHSGRPISDVLDQLQSKFLSPITYEEVAYENEADLTTRTTLVIMGKQKLMLGPPVGDFSVTFGSADSTPYMASQSVLSAYSGARLPGVYRIVQQNGRVDFVPAQVLGVSGSMLAVRPLMSSPIKLPLATRSVLDTLTSIVDQISVQSGKKVILLSAPFGGRETIELAAAGEGAADVISDIGNTLRVPLSFRCLYDATDTTYYLLIQAVTAPNTPGGPAKHGPLIQLPATSGPGSPYFVKTP